MSPKMKLALLLAAAPTQLHAQNIDGLENLQALPESTTATELVALMGTFTRALGVKCSYCHVEQAGQQLAFELDDKVTKRKAREMLRMVLMINDSILPGLERRTHPEPLVTCFTCHRGMPIPRTLQDTLGIVYDKSGLSALVAEYSQLRSADHGDGMWDFSSVPLADVASSLGDRGHLDDAEAVHSLNVEQNPESDFARREHLRMALTRAYRSGIETGNARWEELERHYPQEIFRESMLNAVGYVLMRGGNEPASVTVFRRIASRYPDSDNVWDSLGDGLVAIEDIAGAREAYQRSLTLDPSDEATAKKLSSLPD
jgi:hypothetical protein